MDSGTKAAPEESGESLQPKRIAGRIWVVTKLGTFVATLICLFLDQNLWATVFLLASLFMGFYASSQIRHEDMERPQALFWLELGEKALGNLIFLVLFLRMMWDPDEPFP